MPILKVSRRSVSRPSVFRCPLPCQCQRRSKHPQHKHQRPPSCLPKNVFPSHISKPGHVLASQKRQNSGHRPVNCFLANVSVFKPQVSTFNQDFELSKLSVPPLSFHNIIRLLLSFHRIFSLPLRRHPVSKGPQPPTEGKATSPSEEIVTPPVKMVIITPLMVAVNPEVQLRAFEPGTERTFSSEEENSQLLNAFLKSCDGTASIHLVPAKAVSLKAPNPIILTIPLNITKKILRSLLTSPIPLILHHDTFTTSADHRTFVQPNVLQVCKVFHNVGIPILYGENTLTTSSPSTSFDFDEHLLFLPASKRQMITNVKLEIDWADQLWAKFPLVARALGELKGLQKLEIVIVKKEKMVEEKQTALIEKNTNLKIMITYDKISPGKHRTVRQRAPTTDSADGRVKRDGSVAEVMLKAEMKMLRDLVTGFKGLKDFRLVGFRHEVFAWCLQEHVRIGNH